MKVDQIHRESKSIELLESSVIDICKVVRKRCKVLEKSVSNACHFKIRIKGWMVLTGKLGSPSGCRALTVVNAVTTVSA